MRTQFNGFQHICITQKSNKGWWLNQRPVCKFYWQYLNILIWKKYDEFFPTTINYCSVRGKRVFFRGKREWCWTRAGGRISRGWKLSLQHLESAELQAADREKNLGGGGFSVEVVNSLEHGVKAAKWRERDISGACLPFKIFWYIHLHYRIFSFVHVSLAFSIITLYLSHQRAFRQN